MPYIMVIRGTAFELYAKPKYLEKYDPDGNNGRGYILITDDISEAKRFESAHEAMMAWKKQSTVDPIRPDGKPNRPLSSFTVEILKVSK